MHSFFFRLGDLIILNKSLIFDQFVGALVFTMVFLLNLTDSDCCADLRESAEDTGAWAKEHTARKMTVHVTTVAFFIMENL